MSVVVHDKDEPLTPSAERRKLKRLITYASIAVVLIVATTLILFLWRSDDSDSEATATYNRTIDNAEALESKSKPVEAAESLNEYAKTAKDPYQKAYAKTLEGAIYERNGKLEEAREAYETGVDLPAAKGGLAANEGLGRVEAKLGNKEKAIAHWRKAIELKRQIHNPLMEEDIMNYERYIKALGGTV